MSQVREGFDWVKDMKTQFNKLMVSDLDDKKIEQAIEFSFIDREKYVAEVGKKDGLYIYHLYPKLSSILETFGDKLGDAFISVFKFKDRLSAKHDEVMRCREGEKEAEEARKAGNPVPVVCGFWGPPEEFTNNSCPNCDSNNIVMSLNSWAVRVSGYADNPLADELSGKVFDVLDELLKETEH
jgi:hypothetical protein